MKFQTLLLIFILVWHAGLPAALGYPDKPPKPEAVEVYDQGRRLLESGDIDAAIKILEKAVKADRKFADAQNKLAEAYMARNTLRDRIKAERALKRALTIDRTNVDYNINLGKLRLLQGLPISAREQFNRALRRNPDAVRVHYELGLIHTRQMLKHDHMVSVWNPQDMVLFYGEHALRATRTDRPRDYLPRGTVANMSDLSPAIPGFEDQAPNTDIIDIDGRDLGPLIEDPAFNERLGITSYSDILSRRAEAVGTFTEIFREYAEEDYQKAHAAFERVLTLSPEDRGANYQMGLLAFYREQYQDMIRSMRRVVMNHPGDTDAYLALGLGLMRLKEYGAAGAMWNRAKSLMTADERRILESADYFLPNARKDDRTDQTTDRINQDYWRSQDPLFITPYNERELEHYARVAEANLRFSVTANANSTGIKAIPGWQTDRGLAFIKYGPPPNWWRLRDDLGYRGLEMWQYPEFSLGFHDPFSTGRATFGGPFEGINFREVAAVVQKEHKERYFPDYAPRQFDLPFAITQFRGREGMTDLHVSYGLPGRKLRFLPGPNGYQATVTRGIFLFDRDWQPKLRNIDNVTVESGLKFAVRQDRLYPAVQTLVVRPAEYQMAIEIEDQYEGNTGVVRQTLTARDFTSRALLVSDILFADNIIPPETTENIKRIDFQIDPNIRHVYTVFHPVFIYYEIYNLLIDPVTGRSRYRVECAIENEEREQGGFWEYLPGGGDEDAARGRIVTTAEYEGNTPTEHQYLRINVGNSPPGVYTVRLRVQDLMTGREVVSESRITLRSLEPRQQGPAELNVDVLRDGLFALRADPDDPLTHYHLGVIAYNAHRLDDAVVEYQKSLAQDEETAEVHYALALTYRDQGAVSRAYDAAERARQLGDNHIRYRQLAGALAYATGDLDRALALVDTEELEGRAAGLYYVRGRVIQLPGALEQSALAFNQAALLDDDLTEAQFAFGQSLILLGRPDDAESWLERVRVMDPHFQTDYVRRRFPAITDEWIDEAGAPFRWFVETSVSGGDADSTRLRVGYMAALPPEVLAHGSVEMEAQLRLFDARWSEMREWSWQRRSTVVTVTGTSANTNHWISDSWEVSCAPGRYHLILTIFDKTSRRYGHVVREILVPVIAPEGVAMSTPQLTAINRSVAVPWYTLGDTLTAEVALLTEIPPHATIQWEVRDLLKRDTFILKKLFRGLSNRKTYFSRTQNLDLRAGNILSVRNIILQDMKPGAYQVRVRVFDANGKQLSQTARRFTLGRPAMDDVRAPLFLSLLPK